MTPLEAVLGLTSAIKATGQLPREWEDIFYYAQGTRFENTTGRKVSETVLTELRSDYYENAIR
jgi:hypothetical protein